MGSSSTGSVSRRCSRQPRAQLSAIADRVVRVQKDGGRSRLTAVDAAEESAAVTPPPALAPRRRTRSRRSTRPRTPQERGVNRPGPMAPGRRPRGPRRDAPGSSGPRRAASGAGPGELQRRAPRPTVSATRSPPREPTLHQRDAREAADPERPRPPRTGSTGSPRPAGAGGCGLGHGEIEGELDEPEAVVLRRRPPAQPRRSLERKGRRIVRRSAEARPRGEPVARGAHRPPLLSSSRKAPSRRRWNSGARPPGAGPRPRCGGTGGRASRGRGSSGFGRSGRRGSAGSWRGSRRRSRRGRECRAISSRPTHS